MLIDKKYFESAAFSTMGVVELKQSNGDLGMIMMSKEGREEMFKEGGEIELEFSAKIGEELTTREYVEKYL